MNKFALFLMLFSYVHFASFFCYAQSKKSTFSVSLEAGLSPKSKNIFDSGYVNPPQRNPRQFSINTTWEYKPINQKINYGISIKNTIVLTSFGWAMFNDIDRNTNLPITGKYFEKNSFSFQSMKLMVSGIGSYLLYKNSKIETKVSILPSFTLYYPLVQEYFLGQPTNILYIFNSLGTLKVIEGYEIVTNSKNAVANPKVRPEIGISLNQKYKLKSKRTFGVDLNFHFAPSKLYSEYLTFYPELPQFRAKIHYTLNNSYTSIAIRYFFIKKSKTSNK